MLLQEVEKDVKTRTKGEMGAAKTLCSPFDQPALPEGTKFLSKSFLSNVIGQFVSNAFWFPWIYRVDVLAQVPNALHLENLQKNGAIGAEATKLSAHVYILCCHWIRQEVSFREFLNRGAFNSVNSEFISTSKRRHSYTMKKKAFS